MAGLTRTLEQALLNHAFRNVTYTPPTTVYVGLFTATPTDTTAGTEVSGNGYARQACTFSAATATSPSTITNSSAIEFPTATGSWGTVTHFGIFDAATNGTLMTYAAVTTSKAYTTDDIARFPAGSLVASFD